MKTLKSKLVMLAVLMVGAVAMSFTMIDKNSEKVLAEDMLYWFDGDQLVAHGTKADILSEFTDCQETGSEECLVGYSDIDGSNNPSGPQIDETYRP